MSETQLAAETRLFQKFLLWTHGSMRPKRRSDARARPASALAVVLAVKRTLLRDGVMTPPVGTLRRVLHGLERAYVADLGTTALLPLRKAPLTAAMLTAMLSLPSFTLRGRRVTWDSPLVTSIRAMFVVMWATGMRKDDATRLHRAAAWLRPDGGYNLRPGASKADPLGQVWGSYVITLPPPFGGALDASASLGSLPGLPTSRSTFALFPGADSQALAHDLIDEVFSAAAVAALGPEVAATLSTHSFRIGVATRLKAMGFSDDYVARFGRWASP
jgi:integrase